MLDWNAGYDKLGTLTSLMRQALIHYWDEHHRNGADPTPDKTHWPSIRINTWEIALNLHRTKGTDLTPGGTPTKLLRINSRWKAPTSFRDDRHHPSTRTTGTNLAPGHQALTKHQDESDWSHIGMTCTGLADGTTCTILIPGWLAPT